jgi:putative membrane protein
VAYLWTKTFHLLFVIAWMATVFYLPRILVNLAETRGQTEVQARLVLMGRRLYGFGHNMFGIAVILGLLLWLGHKLSPALWPNIVAGMAWMHAKLALVAALLAYFIVAGRWLKKAAAGGDLPSPTTLRWFNELPLLFLIPLIFLVLAKPF